MRSISSSPQWGLAFNHRLIRHLSVLTFYFLFFTFDFPAMLRTRLWMGTILVLLTAGALVVDQRLAPWYPVLLALMLALAGLACYELVGLLSGARRPPLWLCQASV